MSNAILYGKNAKKLKFFNWALSRRGQIAAHVTYMAK